MKETFTNSYYKFDCPGHVSDKWRIIFFLEKGIFIWNLRKIPSWIFPEWETNLKKKKICSGDRSHVNMKAFLRNHTFFNFAKILGLYKFSLLICPLAARLQPFKMFTKVSRYNCFSICLDSCRHAGIGIYIPEKNSKSYYRGNWEENLIVFTAVPWLMVFFSLITLNFRL